MITVNAWLAALPRKGPSPHHQLFAALAPDLQDWKESNHVRKTLFVELQGHIIARLSQQPSRLPSKPMTLNVSNGDTFTIAVRLAGMMPSRQFKDGETWRKEKARNYTLDEMQTKVQAMLSAMGDIKSLTMTPVNPVPVSVAKRVLPVPGWDVLATLVVTNESAFAAAWSQGLGRFKSYGFGMIREKKQ